MDSKVKYVDKQHKLLKKMLIMDPTKRITSEQAMSNEYFKTEPCEGAEAILLGLAFQPTQDPRQTYGSGSY